MSKRKRNEDLILAQWQTYVEMANSVSQRRDAMNNVFITLNLALLTAVSLAWDLTDSEKISSNIWQGNPRFNIKFYDVSVFLFYQIIVCRKISRLHL